MNNINFKNKKALIRVDFNVPLNKDLSVGDNTRIVAAMPTIKEILNNGGACVLMSHLGRPNGERSEKLSLKNIIAEVEKQSGAKVSFIDDCVGDKVKTAVSELKTREILLLENLRFYPGEKKGDLAFAESLAKLGADYYINDAFGTAHRAHASTSVIAQFFEKENRAFGLLMDAEIANAEKVLKSAEKPLTAILGGAKVSDKIEIINNLMPIADNIIIGGGMAYTFFKAQDGEIGNSLCEDDKLDLAKELLEKAKQNNTNIILPVDSICADDFTNNANTSVNASNKVPEGMMGLDIGKQAIEDFKRVIENSKTILWNGPMGVFEMPAFQQGTKAIALSVAAATKTGAFSLIGGGDSVAAIKKFNLEDEVSYVSTGGGAMLEFFEGKTLPGISSMLS
ncbi:UNVERIFIED_CONTAM: hypothetical protein GTU68_060691 [Idotea baltica]|nr:hypothetical protein [Idotea baltica]